jgi:chromosome segregation ATPase
MNMLPPNPSHGHDSHFSDGHVGQIRDILFGGQMREYDHRFAQLEDRIVAEHERLRLETEERMRVLQEQAAAGARQVAESLQAEKAERASAAEAFAQETRQALENLHRTLSELKDASEHRHREQTSQMEELRRSIDRARGEREELATRIDQQLRHLTEVAVDRSVLGDLLGEMSARLKNRPVEGA